MTRPPLSTERPKRSSLLLSQSQAAHPNALSSFEAFAATVLAGKRPAVFLDYDGTLTPIVRDPDAATLAPAMRRVVAALARVFPTAIVSGRGREKVSKRGSVCACVCVLSLRALTRCSPSHHQNTHPFFFQPSLILFRSSPSSACPSSTTPARTAWT